MIVDLSLTAFSNKEFYPIIILLKNDTFHDANCILVFRFITDFTVRHLASLNDEKNVSEVIFINAFAALIFNSFFNVFTVLATY